MHSFFIKIIFISFYFSNKLWHFAVCFHSVSVLKVWRLSTLPQSGFLFRRQSRQFSIVTLSSNCRRCVLHCWFCNDNKLSLLTQFTPHLLNRLQENTGDSYCSILPSINITVTLFLVLGIDSIFASKYHLEKFSTDKFFLPIPNRKVHLAPINADVSALCNAINKCGFTE